MQYPGAKERLPGPFQAHRAAGTAGRSPRRRVRRVPSKASHAPRCGAGIRHPADFTASASCHSVAFQTTNARSLAMLEAAARESTDKQPATKQFLLVDDHPILRDAISQTLADLLPGSRTDLATSIQESRNRFATGRRYDYVLLDLQLPDSAGHDSLVHMRALAPDTPIIVITGDARRDVIVRCLEMGALGYIPKSLQADVVRHALRLAISGQVYVPREVLAAAASERPVRGARPDPRNPRSLGLTARQVDVLRLMMQGLPNKLICRELQLAEGTVKVHVSAVLRALAVNSRTQAVITARDVGIEFDH
jgi:DNA-binding NarL/FixJ family response regulator